mgnify:FL=1
MKLSYRRTFCVGFAFLSICAFWQLYDSIIPLMLKNSFHLKETVSGAIMAIDNVLALFLLPLLGALSDRTHTRLGRRMPFIVVGTLLSAVFAVIIPIAALRQDFVLFFVSLGLVLLSMGLYRSPAVALMPDVTPKPLRSKANAVINLMGAAGSVFTLVMVTFLVKEAAEGQLTDYRPVFTAVALLMVACVVILLLTVRENRMAAEVPVEEEEKKEEASGVHMTKDVRKSLIFLLLSVFFWFTAYNAVTTAYTRYVEVMWGVTGGGFAGGLMVGTVAAVISYLPIGILSSRFGRKRMIQFGILCMTAAYAVAFTLTGYNAVMYVLLVVIGIGWAAINVNSYPMVVEMSHGSDTGRYTGFYYTFSMAAQVLTPVLSGFLLEHVGYQTLFPYAVLFSVLSFVTMWFVRHGDVKPVKKADLLENFDVDD